MNPQSPSRHMNLDLPRRAACCSCPLFETFLLVDFMHFVMKGPMSLHFPIIPMACFIIPCVLALPVIY